MTLQELREKRASLIKSAQEIRAMALTDSRELTDDEVAKIKELLDGAGAAEGAMAAAEESEASRAAVTQKLAAGVASLKALEQRVTRPTSCRIEIPHGRKELRAFKGPDARRNAYVAFKWFRAALFGDTAANRWLQDHDQRVAVTTDNALGGVLVPEVLETAIIDLREEYGSFRKNAKVRTMTSDTFTSPRRVSGLTAYWEGETDSATESDKGWDSVKLSAKKMRVLTKLSTEMEEDSAINIIDDLTQEIAYAFAYKEDLAGWNGDGTSTYGGVLGVAGRLVTGLTGYISASSGHDTFAEIDSTDLYKAIAALPKYARAGAKWYCNSVCEGAVFNRLQMAGGGNTADNLAGPAQPKYLGYPIEVCQALTASAVLPTTAITGAMLYFGDLAMAASLGDRKGVTLAVARELYMANDEIGIYGRQRLDINVHDVGSTSAAGPLVALVAA